MQNYDKAVARRFVMRGAGHLHQRIVDINVFDKRQSLRARIHNSKQGWQSTGQYAY